MNDSGLSNKDVGTLLEIAFETGLQHEGIPYYITRDSEGKADFYIFINDNWIPVELKNHHKGSYWLKNQAEAYSGKFKGASGFILHTGVRIVRAAMNVFTRHRVIPLDIGAQLRDVTDVEPAIPSLLKALKAITRLSSRSIRSIVRPLASCTIVHIYGRLMGFVSHVRAFVCNFGVRVSGLERAGLGWALQFVDDFLVLGLDPGTSLLGSVSVVLIVLLLIQAVEKFVAGG